MVLSDVRQERDLATGPPMRSNSTTIRKLSNLKSHKLTPISQFQFQFNNSMLNLFDSSFPRAFREFCGINPQFCVDQIH
jgi:hypothetical protein